MRPSLFFVMNVLYVKKDVKIKQGNRRRTLELLYDYMVSYNNYKGSFEEFRNSASFDVEEKGKPVLKGFELCFSISHSGAYWVLLVSPENCGVDIQEIKKVDCDKISQRFYRSEEYEYVAKKGLDGFFDIWTRREAFGKMTGEGFNCSPPCFIDGDGETLIDETSYLGEKYYFISGLESSIKDGNSEALSGYKLSLCLRKRDLKIVYLT